MQREEMITAHDAAKRLNLSVDAVRGLRSDLLARLALRADAGSPLTRHCPASLASRALGR
ncbi:MAG: hypothetical protein RLZZ387_3459 [Chloroflexota bacterium]|jgi:hypothetical protein